MKLTYTRLMSRRGLVAGAIGAVAGSAAITLPARCQGRIYPGSLAGATDLSGMTRDEARASLADALAPFEQHAATFTFGDQAWTPGLADLGYAVDYEAMLDVAMGSGRESGLLDRYSTLLGMSDPHRIPLLTRFDPETLTSYLGTIDEAIRLAPANARLTASETGEVSIAPSRAGRKLHLTAAEDAIHTAIAAGRRETISLDSIEIAPNVTEDQLAAAKADALGLISSPVFFTHEGETYPIDTDTLADALVIDDDGSSWLDAGMIQERVDAIARAIARPPQNVMLGWDSGLYVVMDDVPGIELDRDAFAIALTKTARAATRIAPLLVREVPAAARTDNIDELGLDQHLAYGSSSFAGSSRTRATNVVVSANNISYKLVPPGEEFSFNDLLGPITLDMGYVEGSIIQGDWTTSDIGGGVCQVSTTVFRAAARAGFPFTEWHPHSWRLAFYEEDGSPPGLDAAIYQPNVEGEWEKDLRFRNTLDSWLLMMMVVDGDTVRAHFYGRDPGWTVKIGEARVSEPKPLPDPVERHNPDLAPGERRQVQLARPGYTVRIRRTITDRYGALISDGDFVSDYRSQPEAWEVG